MFAWSVIAAGLSTTVLLLAALDRGRSMPMALGLDRWVPVAVVVAAVAALAAVGRRLGYPLAGALVMLTVGLALVAPQILLAWHRRVLTTARNTCETTLKNRTEALADVERRLEEFRCPAQDRPMCGPKAAAP